MGIPAALDPMSTPNIDTMRSIDDSMTSTSTPEAEMVFSSLDMECFRVEQLDRRNHRLKIILVVVLSFFSSAFLVYGLVQGHDYKNLRQELDDVEMQLQHQQTFDEHHDNVSSSGTTDSALPPKSKRNKSQIESSAPKEIHTCHNEYESIDQINCCILEKQLLVVQLDDEQGIFSPFFCVAYLDQEGVQQKDCDSYEEDEMDALIGQIKYYQAIGGCERR